MKSAIALFTGLVALVATAPAATLVFDENSVPNNDPVNGFGSFTFDDFAAPGAVTDGPTSLILDIQDSNGSNGVFGGVGVDYVLESPAGSMNFVPQDFDASTHEWQLRVKLLSNNEATGINAAFIDDDGAGTADDHQYSFDLTSVPDDGEFHVLTLPLDSPGFTQGAFGFTPGDGLANPGLRQIQVQGQFGSTGRLNVEVDYLQIVPSIPEPASAVLLCFALLAVRRRA